MYKCVKNVDKRAKKEIINHLCDILDGLCFTCQECCVCGWIDHAEDKWYRCDECEEAICEKCYKKADSLDTKEQDNKEQDNKIYCNICSDSIKECDECNNISYVRDCWTCDRGFCLQCYPEWNKAEHLREMLCKQCKACNSDD